MSRAEITTNIVTRQGIAPTSNTGASLGHKFKNNERVLVRVTNSSTTAARNVIFQTTEKVDGDLVVPNRQISIPANSSMVFGPFPRRIYNKPQGDADAGMVFIDYDSTTPTDLKTELLEMGS